MVEGNSMDAINETLRSDLLQPEFSEGYSESFQDAYVATQIKVLREENAWTQDDLAKQIGTTQTAISRIENVNYSAWNIRTLKKLARAFRVRLKVSFETYGSLIHDFEGLNRESLMRAPREKDPVLVGDVPKVERLEGTALASVDDSHRIRLRRKPASIRCFRANRRTQTMNRKPPQRESISSMVEAYTGASGNNSIAAAKLIPSAGGNESSGTGVFRQ